MRILGLDFGRKRIGLALSDPLGQIASPWQVVERGQGWWEQLLDLIQQQQVSQVVVGLPREMNGQVGPAGQACQKFAQELEQRSGLKVDLLDERLTSIAASAAMRESGIRAKDQRGKLDSVAASLILQVYLEQRRRQGS